MRRREIDKLLTSASPALVLQQRVAVSDDTHGQMSDVPPYPTRAVFAVENAGRLRPVDDFGDFERMLEPGEAGPPAAADDDAG